MNVAGWGAASLVALLGAALLLCARAGFAANPDLGAPPGANAAGSDEIPKLRPPLPEIPPSFWDQHGLGISCAASVLMIVAAGGVWHLTRPKPPVPVAPAVQARGQLESLRAAPEDGAVVSRVSRVVRYYFSAAFNLPAGELTTSEFSRAIEGVQKLGPELKIAVVDFLRRCDERKFSPSPARAPLGAAARAVQIIEEAETRRVDLDAAAGSKGESGARSSIEGGGR